MGCGVGVKFGFGHGYYIGVYEVSFVSSKKEIQNRSIRGHGYTDAGLKAHIPDINPVADNCVAFFDSFHDRHVPLELPSFLYAKSLGIAIALLITLLCGGSTPKRLFDGITDVVLEFQAACKSDQEDRIAAVWLDGVELLCTTTPQPGSSGVYWKVSKDVTKYSSLLNSKEISLAVMLENSVNYVFTGAFDVNVTFVYYDSKGAAALGNCVRSSETVVENPIAMTVDKPMNPPVVPDDGPADSIIPISAKGEHGFWFSIQTDSQVVSKEVTIPQNAYKATVEIYATSHGNDEFWYSHPPDSYANCRLKREE
nr:peptide-N4-(N-acetyl-beta-glucosaminyl) asparagine amidase A-like [Ipomoea batatas]